MDRSMIMMMNALADARPDTDLTPEDSQGVLLLDFAKAYDTIDRDFLMEVLTKFGFSPEFIFLMKQLHEETTARFLVNGTLSEPIDVKSGIRQGCLLAPLLFILAVEPLGLGMKQHPGLQELTIARGDGCNYEHRFVVKCSRS